MKNKPYFVGYPKAILHEIEEIEDKYKDCYLLLAYKKGMSYLKFILSTEEAIDIKDKEEKEKFELLENYLRNCDFVEVTNKKEVVDKNTVYKLKNTKIYYYLIDFLDKEIVYEYILDD